jgi:hypothetical protein
MTINEWCQAVHELSKSKGWYDSPRSPLEIHALIHCEVSEASEEARKGSPGLYYDGNKPEGEAVELADAMIRILDYFAVKGWDLEDILTIKHAYNKTRPHRHGGKLY